MNDTHKDRERVGQKMSMVCRSYPFHLYIPLFIHPHSSLGLSLAFVWVWPESGGLRQKNAACHGERAKVLAHGRRGGRVVLGWSSVRVWKALSRLRLSIVVSGLAFDQRLPRPSLPSLMSFKVHILLKKFDGLLLSFPVQEWNCRKRGGEMWHMSGMFILLAVWQLQPQSSTPQEWWCML